MMLREQSVPDIFLKSDIYNTNFIISQKYIFCSIESEKLEIKLSSDKRTQNIFKQKMNCILHCMAQKNPVSLSLIA